MTVISQEWDPSVKDEASLQTPVSGGYCGWHLHKDMVEDAILRLIAYVHISNGPAQAWIQTLYEYKLASPCEAIITTKLERQNKKLK